jgi:hypothetical protein
MEITCPSCSSKHRTEDYPGAFEIQCACGYSLLVPDEAAIQAAPSDFNALEEQVLPDFDAAPMAQEHQYDNAKVALASDDLNSEIDPSVMTAQAQDEESSPFSSLNLTPPEELPEGMPYDSFELESQWKSETPAPDFAAPAEPQEKTAQETPPAPKPVVAQTLVDRIQMASIGYMHGALFDMELGEVADGQIKALSEHCTKFLDDKPWLRAHVDKGFERPESLLKQKKLSAVPELLAVEIYLYCAQSRIPCEFRAHRS